MKSRVFVSCGQRTEDERRIAQSIRQILEDRGFTAYLAIDVQTILDINGGIIRELKNSDYYLFVNFRREPIGGSEGECQFRGSLFSNQELAIAYSLGFEKLLVINQEGVRPEGLLRYLGVNTDTFRDLKDCLAIVERELDRAGWKTDYSRRLRADNLRFSDSKQSYAALHGWFLYLDIHNDRPDIAALEATAKLSGYKQVGPSFEPSSITSPLKAARRREGYYHTIFPKSHEAFDLLVVAHGETTETQPMITPYTHPATAVFSGPAGAGVRIYLNSALDVTPMPPLPLAAGEWTLRYEFFAIDFPLLTVDIEVDVPQSFSTQKAPNARLVSQGVK